jgi:hypothetical protein
VLEVAGVAVALLGRIDVALFGGMDEPPELFEREFDSAGTVTVTEPEGAGGGGAETEGEPVGSGDGFPAVADAGGASLAGGIAPEDCGDTGGGAGADEAGVPGGFADETGGFPGGGWAVAEAGGADSTGRVPGTGGTPVAGGAVPHAVTVTVSVTVLATSE